MEYSKGNWLLSMNLTGKICCFDERKTVPLIVNQFWTETSIALCLWIAKKKCNLVKSYQLPWMLPKMNGFWSFIFCWTRWACGWIKKLGTLKYVDFSPLLLVKNNYLEILMLVQTEVIMKTVALNCPVNSDERFFQFLECVLNEKATKHIAHF